MLSIPYFRVVGHPNLQVGQNGRWDLASLDVSVTVWDTEKKLGMKLSSYSSVFFHFYINCLTICNLKCNV